MRTKFDAVLSDCAEEAGRNTADSFRQYAQERANASCESEIEKVLFVALLVAPVDVGGFYFYSGDFFNLVGAGPWKENYKRVAEQSFVKRGAIIFPQQRVRSYRADFVVVGIRSLDDEPLPVVVECDGHDYHDRTKEQAARDKRRDREMTAEGYRVLRFTGSEIWRDPHACANEVMDLISTEFAKSGKAG